MKPARLSLALALALSCAPSTNVTPDPAGGGGGGTASAGGPGGVGGGSPGTGGGAEPAAFQLPGTLQAEDFDEGGEGVAYHDTTPGNMLGDYRATDVDVGTCSDQGGGYRVGYVFPGEWLRYTLSASAAGTYWFELRYATDASASMHLELDGVNVSGPIALPSTGGWFTWASARVPGIAISQGRHTLRVVADTGNVDWNWFGIQDRCAPETDADLCTRLAACSTVTAPDRCGTQRTVSCACAPLSAEPAALALGDVYVGQTRAMPVLLTNTGTAPLSITALTATGPFTAALEPTRATPPALPLSLAPGKTTWALVSFSPAQAGAVAGRLDVLTSGGARSVAVTATGLALPNVSDVTSFGAKGDGVTDDTAAFRAAAATGRLVVVPAPLAGKHYRLSATVHLTGPGIIGTGTPRPLIKMYGANGDGIRAPDGFGHVMFVLDDWPGTTPAVVSGLELDGQWDGSSVVAEWDHLLMLRAARNVVVENNVLRNPMGDCIILGGEGKADPSRQITISNNLCENPWRCSVALIHSDGVKVVANRLHKPNGHVVNGTWYHFNVDLEPNPNGFEQDWNVEIAFNEITARMFDGSSNGVGVVLSHGPTGIPPTGAGGNVSVHDNSGAVGGLFFQPNGWCQPSECPNLWSNVTAFRNPNPLGCYAPWASCP